MSDDKGTVQADIDKYKIKLEKINTVEKKIVDEWKKENPDKALIAYLKSLIEKLEKQ
jgi:hypothetical protein